MQRKHIQGFSLLEAIVSMVLISTLGASLFLWLNSGLSSLYRVKALEEENVAKLNVLEFSSSLNPMQSGQGSQDFGTYQAEWKAKPLTEIFDATNYPTGIGLYQVALYEITFSVTRAGGEKWFEMTTRQPGFKKVRGGMPLIN